MTESARPGAPRGVARPGAPRGATQVAAVIGDPVRHSLSPTIYNAAFEAEGLDWVFVAFEVPDGSGAAAVDAMRTLDLGWLSVTMPHKRAVVKVLDRLSPAAEELDAVNCIVNDHGELVGHNTDGEGFLRALAAETGFVPAGRTCAVVGAGGAARAVIAALARADAHTVVVVNRTPSRAEAAAALAGSLGRVGEPADLVSADLVVNATSVGMSGDTSSAVDPAGLRFGQVVADLVYEPLVTPLVDAARARGITAVGGLGMLVHQAAIQFELVTGCSAPLDVMQDAARAGLGR